MFIKEKVIVKRFKPKDSNKCVYKKEKVLVKHFKGKNFMEICLLNKRLFGNFLNVKIRSKYVF